MDFPLAQKRILITRDHSQVGEFSKELSSLGAEVFCVPTIAIGPPPSWGPFDQAAQQCSQYDWVIFTSVNAVIETMQRVKELKLSLSLCPNLKFAVVGKKTGSVLAKYGFEASLIPDNFQAEGLFEELKKEGVQGRQIWFPRALDAREWLVDRLKEAGGKVDLTPVYQNKIPLENRNPLNVLIKEQNLDWVVFTSSSTASNFFYLLDPGFHSPSLLPQLASIGKVTTKTLEKIGFSPVFTALPQNLEGLIQGMITHSSDFF